MSFLVEIRNDKGHVIGFVFLEVDEHKHSWYGVECEVRRMADVHLSLTLAENTFPIMFLRYNPHRFSVDGKVFHTSKYVREQRLVEYLRNVTFDQPFSVTYMFYDAVNGVPKILDDPGYEESFKCAVVDCVVA
jgi:hypothetical protein